MGCADQHRPRVGVLDPVVGPVAGLLGAPRAQARPQPDGSLRAQGLARHHGRHLRVYVPTHARSLVRSRNEHYSRTHVVCVAVGFVDMRRAEEKYTQLPANVDGAVKFAVLNNKFRTERNVYLYSLSLLVLLYVFTRTHAHGRQPKPRARYSHDAPVAQDGVAAANGPVREH